MKKPLLAVLGLITACAACCTIPLLLPVLGGTAAAALLARWGLELGLSLNIVMAASLVGGAGVALWMRRRRKVPSDNFHPAQAACALPYDGCGCRPKAVS